MSWVLSKTMDIDVNKHLTELEDKVVKTGVVKQSEFDAMSSSFLNRFFRTLLPFQDAVAEPPDSKFENTA